MRKTNCRINKKGITLNSNNDKFIIVVKVYYYTRESVQIVHEIIRTYCFGEIAIILDNECEIVMLFGLKNIRNFTSCLLSFKKRVVCNN